MRLTFTLFFAIIFCTTVVAAPNADEYTDYLPKYRSQTKNILLTKIDYTKDKMIVHFSYVIDRNEELLNLSGAATSDAWRLYVSARGTSGLTMYATLKNIKHNNALKDDKIGPDEYLQLTAKKGEIVEGEAHFERLPSSIRAVNFSGGNLFTCNDILIKDDRSPMLGSKSQMDANKQRFYNMMGQLGIEVQEMALAPTVANPKPVQDESLAAANSNTTQKEALKKKEVQKLETVQIKQAAQPIDYTPKELSSVEDIECSTRVILKNVYFRDNSAKFAGRVKALQTITVIVEYLQYYPKAKIVLHGHTDVLGNLMKNNELSKDRAEAVRNELVLNGIENDRIIVLYHGGTQPLPGFEKGNSKNRRVEAEVMCAE